MRKFGIIGYPLGHSFSKKYYLEKFEKEGIRDAHYDMYPIADIRDFAALYGNDDKFHGFNVTLPHKQTVIPFLDELSDEARDIGAVNCIQIRRKEGGKPYLKGFNTDALGFERSIFSLLKPNPKALVLGNGGAAKAVFYALKKLGVPFTVVSRSAQNGDQTYADLTETTVREHSVIINCSPLGTFPDVANAPNIPYGGIGANHLLYDLVYNPEETVFLRKGKERGAAVKNGLEMLVLQAEKNWEIWNPTAPEGEE